MKDERKTKKQLIAELAEMRQRAAELEASQTERRRAEEALRESEERLRAIFAGAQDAIFTKDREGYYTNVNPACASLFELTVEEMIGKTDSDLFPPEVACHIREEDQRVLEKGEVVSTEDTKPAASVVRSFHVVKVPLRDASGEIVGLSGIARDITRRKRAEQALRESEQERAIILDSLSEVVVYQDRELRIRWVNRAAGESAGSSPEQLAGRHCYEIWHQRSEPCIGCPVVKALETGEPQEGEMTTPDGRVWSVRGYPVQEEDGHVVGAVEVTLDITERKRLEIETEERRLYLESVLACAPDAIVTLDAQSNILEWNSGAERLFGYTLEEVVGRDIDDLITASDTSVFEEATGLTRQVLDGQSVPPTETVRYRKDGSPVDVIVAGAPILVGEDLVGVVAVYTDITERVRSEEERARAEEALRRERDLAEALEEATAALTATLDFDQVLDRILEQVSRVVPNDATDIMLIEGDQAHIVRWRGYDRFGAEESVSTVSFHIPEVRTLRQMLENREPMVIPDTATYPDWVHVPAQDWLHSYAAAPIIARGEVIGFLNVDSATPDFFTQAHAQALRAFADHAAAAIENARMYQAEQERRHVAETLRQVSTVLSSTLELDELLGLILQQLRQVIPYDTTSVQLLQGRVLSPSKGEHLEIVACQGFERPDKVMGLTFPLDSKFPNYHVVTTKAPLAIEDVARDYPHFQNEADNYKSGRIVSWLGVPLMVRDQVIGVITLDRVQKRPYTAEEAQLAMTFANQAAIAIENARLYQVVREELVKRERAQEALRRRAEELAALQATVLDITAPHDLPVLLQTIVERAARLLNALGGGMYLCDPDRGQVRCMVSHNTPRDYTGTVLKYGEGAAGTVAQTGEPLIIDDYRIWPGRAAVFEKEQPFTAVLGAPMIWQGQVTGVIHVLHDVESRCFTQADLELLTLFANHAAIAIENARLYELVRQELVKRERAQKELRQYAQRLRALRAIDGAILAAWSPQEVAQAAMRHVRKLIPCQRASVAVFDVGTDEATLIATHAGGETTVGAGTRLSPEDFGDSAAFRLGKHYVVEDIAALPRPTPTEQALCEEGVRSFMRLPLIAHGKLVGTLSLGAGSPGSFAAEHVDIGRELADELAIGIQQARLHEQTQRHAEELEQQVAQRTRDLERRTLHLQVAAEVARDATTARDLDDLLNRAVNLIRERFEFYHAGIFLVDERDEYAVLRAATGEAGRHMLEQGHRLKVGEQGIVGDVTGSGQPHIALDVGADAVHFDNPLLPETRLEMALPLKVGERVIGALDVQSIREAAFDEESVAALQIMADQLAVAIEKTRLFEQTQAALEERLRTVVSNTPVILYALDRDGVCTFAEGKGLENLGAKPEDAIGQSVFDILADTPQIPEAARRALAGETSSLVVEIGGLTFEVWYSPLRDESGEISGVIGVATDTTERKHLEEQMRQQERMAAIGQLAGGIAHDFNNFLTSIMLYAQLLLAKPQLLPDMKRNVEIILDESRGAAQLVQQILDFSRRAMIETGPVDLKPFIEKTVDILKRTIPENIRLVVEIEPDEYAVPGEAGAPPFIVNADPTRIQQVLINLATNGRDAMPEGGELRIGLSRVEVRPDEKPPVAEMTAGEWVCLAISDTGAGMTEEVRSHLFEPFFTTKGPGLGTGLGLAQVHGIVGQHGGHIGVETEVGQGTTFRIYLPAHELEEADVQKETSALPGGRGETILLVEDEEKVREASREMLESLGYRVLTAANGREALEVYRSAERVNLIITDLVMPEMGGKELARALKKEHPHARVLAITGYALEDDTEDLMEAGILDIIQKPFEVNRLAEIVRRVLDAE